MSAKAEKRERQWSEEAILRAQIKSTHTTGEAKRQKRARLKNMGIPMESQFLKRYTDAQVKSFKETLLNVPKTTLKNALRVSTDKAGKTIWNIYDLDALEKALYGNDSYETPLTAAADQEQRMDIAKFQGFIERVLIKRSEQCTLEQAVRLLESINAVVENTEKEWRYCLCQSEGKRQAAMIGRMYLELMGKYAEALLGFLIFNEYDNTVNTVLKMISGQIEARKKILKKLEGRIPWNERKIEDDFKYYIAWTDLERGRANEEMLCAEARKNMEGRDLEELKAKDNPSMEADDCKEAFQREKGADAAELVEKVVKALVESHSLSISEENLADWLIIYDSMYTLDGRVIKIPIERKQKKNVELHPKDGVDDFVQKEGASKNGWRLMSVPEFAKQWVELNNKKIEETLDERLTYIKAYYVEVRKKMLDLSKQKQIENMESLNREIRKYMGQVMLATLDADLILSESTFFLKICVRVWEYATIMRMKDIDEEYYRNFIKSWGSWLRETTSPV